MLRNTASLDLMEFIETQILPQYAQFDKAHSLEHVTRVIRRSMELAKTTGADNNMVYTIAAYHDIGMSGPQIKIMKEAIENHRASASHAPRSIYGKIVAEADRDLSPEVVFRRAVQFGLANYPQLDQEQQWLRFKEHMDNKYSANGYIKLWIPGSQNEQNLNTLRNIIANPRQLREQFEKYFMEEKQQ